MHLAARCRRGTFKHQSFDFVECEGVDVMSLPVAPVIGAVSAPSTGEVGGGQLRLSGLGLILIALGPSLVIAIAIGLMGFAITDLVRRTATGITAVAEIVENRISPQVANIEAAFDRIGAPLSELRERIDGAFKTIDQLGRVQIARGEWGSSPSAHVKIPPSDVQIGSVSVNIPLVGEVSKSIGTIDNGALFNQETPKVPIPPTPLELSLEPVEKAFAALGPDGVAGKAIGAAEKAADAAIGDIGKLRQPILAIKDGLGSALAQLRAAIGPLVAAFILILSGVAAQLLLYVAGVMVLVVSRPAEFARALMTRGPLGVLGYSRRALLQRGLIDAFGHRPMPPQESLVGDLRQRAARLQSEIAMLRAGLAPLSTERAAS
jgi:hypothetical protein